MKFEINSPWMRRVEHRVRVARAGLDSRRPTSLVELLVPLVSPPGQTSVSVWLLEVSSELLTDFTIALIATDRLTFNVTVQMLPKAAIRQKTYRAGQHNLGYCHVHETQTEKQESGRLNLEKVNQHLRGGIVVNHLGKTTPPVHPNEIRTSVVWLNTTGALANYATEAAARMSHVEVYECLVAVMFPSPHVTPALKYYNKIHICGHAFQGVRLVTGSLRWRGGFRPTRRYALSHTWVRHVGKGDSLVLPGLLSVVLRNSIEVYSPEPQSHVLKWNTNGSNIVRSEGRESAPRDASGVVGWDMSKDINSRDEGEGAITVSPPSGRPTIDPLVGRARYRPTCAQHGVQHSTVLSGSHTNSLISIFHPPGRSIGHIVSLINRMQAI
uniref:Uncharacterized protein n=1 Tax=Timema tahoe TaxID=61484 RepID=A0A7R9IJ84_9NEOP|nr:unnamed protein product [Timema tahoe]